MVYHAIKLQANLLWRVLLAPEHKVKFELLRYYSHSFFYLGGIQSCIVMLWVNMQCAISLQWMPDSTNGT